MPKLKWGGNLEAKREADRAWESLSRNKRKVKPKPKKVTDYGEYLLSKKWKKTRKKALRRAGFKCNGCGSTKHLEVHHKTYARVGREDPSDLEVLCRTCHGERHPFHEECSEMNEEFRAIVG